MSDFEPLRLHFRLEAEQGYWPDGDRIGISVGDLVALSGFADRITKSITGRAMVDLMGELEVPVDEWMPALRRIGDGQVAFSPAQVSELKAGSIDLALSIDPQLLISWAMANLIGETVKQAWTESELAGRFKKAMRNLFGGAGDAVEHVVRTLPADRYEISKASPAGPGATGTANAIRVTFRKLESPEVEAVERYQHLFARESTLITPRVLGEALKTDDLSTSPEAEEAPRAEPRPPEEPERGMEA